MLGQLSLLHSVGWEMDSSFLTGLLAESLVTVRPTQLPTHDDDDDDDMVLVVCAILRRRPPRGAEMTVSMLC